MEACNCIWRKVAADLVYEAHGDGNRRYVIAADGKAWTIDLLIDGECATEQDFDPQLAPTHEEPKRLAQEWESGLW